MALIIQEHLKNLRVQHSLTLEQLGAQTHLSKSALSNHETNNFKKSATRSLTA